MINLIHNNIYDIVFLFTIYSFLGWCIEVGYYFKNKKHFVNRGFLRGPFCPIYGCCIVTLIFLLEPYKNNIIILFLSAFFITSLLEYTTGFLLEKIFKSKWWDYSDDPFNIHGYVCLQYSLLWGAGEIVIITVINPIISNIIYQIPYYFESIFFYFIIFYFILDFLITISSLVGLNKFSYPFELVSINLSYNKVHSISSLYKDKATDKIKSFEIVFHKFKLNNKKFIRTFNDKSSKQLTELIKNIKEKIKKY